MFAAGASRAVARAAGRRGFATAAKASGAAVPNCLVHHGNQFRMHFLNHPGVMALSSLLEMKGVTYMRANFTQQHVDDMRSYDEELARKAQLALDNGLAINFLQLELIEQNLPLLLKEKEQLDAARKEVLGRGAGDYSPLKADTSACENLGAGGPGEGFKLKIPEAYKKLVGATGDKASHKMDLSVHGVGVTPPGYQKGFR